MLAGSAREAHPAVYGHSSSALGAPAEAACAPHAAFVPSTRAGSPKGLRLTLVGRSLSHWLSLQLCENL